jgi:hypothetical protein
LKVAHYEVVGRVFLKATRPARDDRLAACAREAVCEPKTEDSIVPSGMELSLTPFPTFYVAHGRLPGDSTIICETVH